MAKKDPRRKRPSTPDDLAQDQPAGDGTKHDPAEDTSDSQSTFIPGSGDATDDLDKTVELESTVMMSEHDDPSTGLSTTPGDPSLDVDPEHLSTIIPANKTVGNLDQTVEFDPRQLEDTQELDDSDGTGSAGRTVVSHGRGMKTEPDVSSAGGHSTTDLDETDELEATVQAETVAVDTTSDPLVGDGTVGDATKATSLMASNKIGATINPRELTEKDAEFWGSLTLEGSGQSPSVLPPAIDRSLTETKLQIRGRHVVTPRSDPTEPSDYRLMRLLGKGGMGNVYVAKQGSLDRIIAVKVIKPLSREKRNALKRKGKLEQVEQERRQQFVAEAVVTSDLDHPNIVPIHDIAVTSDNTLFYSMKRVSGVPWSKSIKHNSLDENLDILLKVADAIALAHDRGVVHRDIKPENIMVGDYGVVMVMDWGLALAIPKGHFDRDKSIYASSGLGGTPAFMAPEMAVGPLERIGPGSDIYLLGATLFMIVTGKAPHQAGNVSQCLRAVAANQIRPVDEKYHGELLNIALKAMATRPQDRYHDVASFQSAIRDYRSHAESISLAIRAADDLQQAKAEQSYVKFSSATFRFEESIALWDGNRAAIDGLAETRLTHANAAYENGDYDLGLSLLDEQVPEHKPIIEKLREGIRERDSRQSRIKVLRIAAAAMLAFILVGGAAALYVINIAKNDAVLAKNDAVQKKAEAEAARDEAERARAETEIAKQEEEKAKEDAIAAEKIAIQERDNARAAEEKERMAKVGEQAAKIDALEQRDAARIAEAAARKAEAAEREQKEIADNNARIAEQQRKIAEYEKYVSQVGSANARIRSNEFDDARAILNDLLEKEDLGWEAGYLKLQTELPGEELEKLRSPEDLRSEVERLWKISTQSHASTVNDAVLDLAVGQSGRTAVATLLDGSIEFLSLDAGGNVSDRRHLQLQDGASARAVAIDDQNNRIAIGLIGGGIQIYDSQITKLQRTLRGHDRRVNDLEFTPSGLLVSASDDRTARVWDPSRGTQRTACWHITAVQDVDVVEQGGTLLLATAAADNTSGRAVVWNVPGGGSSQGQPRRVGEFLGHQGPVTSVALSPDGRTVASGDSSGVVFLWNSGSVAKVDYQRRIASALTSFKSDARSAKSPTRASANAIRLIDRDTADSNLAHENAVRSIQFGRDGRLLTGSEDYTVKLWEVGPRRLTKTLRGHGGWVIDAAFLPTSSDVVISASNDASIRTWVPSTYDENIPQAPRVADSSLLEIKGYIANAHEDEIWSARLSPDGQRIVTASRDHTARVLELDPETMTFNQAVRLRADDQLDEGTPYVGMSMVVDEPHQRLYVGSADSTVRVWDLDRGTQIGEAPGTGLNTSLTVSRSGRLMLTGSSLPNAKAILWRVDPQGDSPPKIVHLLQGHEQAVTALAISPDESLLFTGDRDGLGILWNATTGKQTATPVGAVRGFRINAATFSVDGKELLIAADDQQLTRFDVKNQQIIGRLPHEGFVTQVSLSPSGIFALTVSEQITDERIRSTATLWQIASEQSRVLDRVDAPRTNKAKSADGGRERITSAQFGVEYPVAMVSRATAGGKPSRIQVWEVANRVADARMIQSFSLPATLPSATAVMPVAGRTMLTLCGDATFHWSLSSLTHLKSYRAHAAVTQASFSFDGQYVVTGSRSVKVWDSRSGKSLCKLEVPHESPVRTVQFSPAAASGYLFATGGDDAIARTWRWDPTSRRVTPVAEYQASGAIRSVCISRGGDKLLAVGDNGTARLWRLDQPDQPAVYDLQDAGNFTCCVFSKDGRWIVVGSNDKRARMWAVVEPGAEPDPPTIFQGHADRIEDVAFLENGIGPPRVLTAARDRSARVWDPQIEISVSAGGTFGREIMSLRRHTKGVTAIDVTDNTRLVMTASRDGKVILWPAGPAAPAE